MSGEDIESRTPLQSLIGQDSTNGTRQKGKGSLRLFPEPDPRRRTVSKDGEDGGLSEPTKEYTGTYRLARRTKILDPRII